MTTALGLLNPVTLVLAGTALLLYAYWNEIGDAFAWTGGQALLLGDSITAGIGAGVEWLMGLDLTSAGVGLVTSFAGGIASMASAPLKAITGIFDSIAAYLPHSDAEVGPFSRLTASGAAIPQTMAKGMGQTEGELAAAMNRMSAPNIAAGPSAGGGSGAPSVVISYSPSVQVMGGAGAAGGNLEAAVLDVLRRNADDLQWQLEAVLAEMMRRQQVASA